MKRNIHFMYIGVLALSVMALAGALQGCASTPVDQRLYIVDAAITQSYQLATDLRKGGYISDSDWPKVVDGLDQASDGLDKAWAIYKTDPDGAAKQLLSVESISAEVKRILNARQKEMIAKSRTR